MSGKLLYGEKIERHETHTFQIYSGGDLCPQESGEVELVFVDGKFSSISLPFAPPYTRNGLRIIAAAEAEARRIEALMDTGRPA